RRCSVSTTVVAALVTTLVLDLFLTPPLLELDDPAEDIVVGLALLLVGLVVKRVDDDVRSARDVWRRLQDSSGQALDAEERVRREIAELLHSRVQSRLVAAWSHLHTLGDLIEENPSQAKVLLTTIMSDLDD